MAYGTDARSGPTQSHSVSPKLIGLHGFFRWFFRASHRTPCRACRGTTNGPDALSRPIVLRVSAKRARWPASKLLLHEITDVRCGVGSLGVRRVNQLLIPVARHRCTMSPIDKSQVCGGEDSGRGDERHRVRVEGSGARQPPSSKRCRSSSHTGETCGERSLVLCAALRFQ